MKPTNIQTFRNKVILKIDEYELEVDIHYNALGELLEVKEYFSELPIEAQRLILGNKQVIVHNRIALLPYILPMIVLGYFEEHGYLEIINTLKGRQYKHELDKIQNEWVKNLYKTHGRSKKIDQLVLPRLAEILKSRPQELAQCIATLTLNKFQLAGPIIYRLANIVQEEKALQSIYRSLVNFPSEANKQLLLDHLADPRLSRFSGDILHGLSIYKSEEVYQLAIQYYHRNEKLSPKEKLSLLHIFINFPNDETALIARNNLLHTNYEVSKSAFDLLMKHEADEAAIASMLDAVFYDPSKVNYWPGVLNKYSYLNDNDLLPRADALINALLIISEKGIDSSFISTLSALLERKYTMRLPSQLINLLEGPSEKVKAGAIRLLYRLLIKYHVVFPPIKRFLGQLRLLLEEESELVRREAAIAVRMISDKLPKREWISHMTQILEKSEDQVVIKTLLETINLFITYRTYDESLVPVCIRLLKHTDPSIRANAIEILNFFSKKHPNVRATLEDMKNDPSPIVQKALK
jgi:hypothetical protein